MEHVLEKGIRQALEFETMKDVNVFLSDKEVEEYIVLKEGMKFILTTSGKDLNEVVDELQSETNKLQTDLRLNFESYLDNEEAILFRSSTHKDYYVMSNGIFISVSKNTGKVWNIKPQWKDNKFRVNIAGKYYDAARLVYTTFIEDIDHNIKIGFKDGNKKNFAVENLFLQYSRSMLRNIPVVIWEDPIFQYTLRSCQDVCTKLNITESVLLEYLNEGYTKVKGFNIEFLYNEDADALEYTEVWSEFMTDEEDM